MKLEPRHERPLRLVELAERALPGCWSALDRMREGRGRDLPEWPTWCYLPIAAGLAVATRGAPIPELGFSARLAGAGLGAPLVALAAWRVTQGIWDYDEDLYRDLWETPVEGRLPTDALWRLPEWAPYVCLRDVTWHGAQLHGFVPWLEWDAHGGPPELRLLLDVDGAGLAELPALSLHLDADTVDECLHRAADEAVRQGAPHLPLAAVGQLRAAPAAQIELVRHLLSLVLYLCSSEPDLTRRPPPGPSSYKKPVLRPPQQPTLWPVGLRIGAALRAAAAQDRGEPGEATGAHVRPHVRRAHWHAYWLGPRAEDRAAERRLDLRWISPVLVGGAASVATVRPVE